MNFQDILNKFDYFFVLIDEKMDRVRTYECEICKSISCVWSEKYLNMDYVKLNCCSIKCKNKYIMNEILEKHNNLPTDINKIIVKF